MRRGFTFIEVVFVIVVIGILASFALPRFLQMSRNAHNSNVQFFVNSLNRNVAPTFWSRVYMEEKESLSDACSRLSSVYTEVPEELTDNGDCTFTHKEDGGTQWDVSFSPGDSSEMSQWSVVKN